MPRPLPPALSRRCAAVCETVFRTELAGSQAAEIDVITDRFYADYQAEIAQNPDGHAMDYVHIIMEIEKQ